MASRGPKIAEGVLKGVYPRIIWRYEQLLQNRFFDPCTPRYYLGVPRPRLLLSPSGEGKLALEPPNQKTEITSF